jgi:hypothetical protein
MCPYPFYLQFTTGILFPQPGNALGIAAFLLTWRASLLKEGQYPFSIYSHATQSLILRILRYDRRPPRQLMSRREL